MARADTPDRRERRRAYLLELRKHVPVRAVTAESGEIAGKLSGEQARRGIKLPIDDLLIAVAAIEQDYAVVTLNLRHFREIPGLMIAGR